MSYPRQIRLVSAIVALLSLLFMQLAMAAYRLVEESRRVLCRTRRFSKAGII